MVSGRQLFRVDSSGLSKQGHDDFLKLCLLVVDVVAGTSDEKYPSPPPPLWASGVQNCLLKTVPGIRSDSRVFSSETAAELHGDYMASCSETSATGNIGQPLPTAKGYSSFVQMEPN